MVIDHFDRPWTNLEHNLGHNCEFDHFGVDGGSQELNKIQPGWSYFAKKILEQDGTPLDRGLGSTARSPRCECEHCVSSTVDASFPPETHSDYDNIIPSETEALTDHQYILCSDQMFGFILKDRTYGTLSSNQICSC